MGPSEISSEYGKDKIKITCIERRYKVASPRVSFIISAKKELDQDVTERLLHEDMELKTFLANYEITNIVFPSILSQKNKIERDIIERDIIERDRIEKKGREERYIEKKEEEKRPDLAKLPTSMQREYVVMGEMPDEFCLQDIVNFYKNRGEQHDILKLKSSFSRTLQQLKKEKKVEIVNPQDNPRNRRYHKLITNKDEIENMYRSLKEGQKILLGTIRD